jgi:alpha-1,3-mannosyltransferase
MQITHVVRQFLPGIGGLENYVANLARAQVRAGHNVRIVTLDRLFSRPHERLAVLDRMDDCEIVRIPWSGSRRYPIAPAVLWHLSGADVVHVHAIDFFFDFLAWTKFLHRKPLVVSTHGGFFHTRYARLIKKAFFQTATRASLRAYRAVLASSVADAALFWPIRRTGLALVENGVDVEKFRDAASPRLTKRMVFIGRFAANKRLDRLFDFLRALNERDAGWALDVVGIEWDLTVSDLSRLAYERGVSGSVRTHLALSDRDILDVLERASFVASASEYEGFGISVIECLSAGLSPVLNDIPAFRRVQAQSGLGLVGDFAQPAQLADRLIRTLPDLERLWDSRRAEATAFAQRFAWSNVARRIEAIYDEVLGRHRRVVAGVPVRVAISTEAIELLDGRIAEGRKTAVTFFNAHAATLARRDRAFRKCLDGFEIFNDGVGVDIASRVLYGTAFPENLNGTDFIPSYLAQTRHALRIFLVGARPNVVEMASLRLAAQFPRHRIVGFQHGFFSPNEGNEVRRRIFASRPDLLLVALGNPRQELWIAEHLEASGACLAFGVGALFDFIVGEVPRAPCWVRDLRAEWLFRLVIEPRRLWRRYIFGNAEFLASVLVEKLRGAYHGTLGRTEFRRLPSMQPDRPEAHSGTVRRDDGAAMRRERLLILHLSGDYPDPIRNRTTAAVKNFIDHLAEFDHLIVSLKRYANPRRCYVRAFEWAGNQKVVAIGYWAPRGGVFHRWRMRRVADEVEALLDELGVVPVLVTAHKLTIEGVVAHELHLRRGLPYACCIRGEVESKFFRFKPGLRRLFGDVIGRAAALYYVSAWFRRWIEERYPLGAQSETLLPNFVSSTIEVAAATPEPGALMTVMDLNLYKKKGLPTLIAALAVARLSLPDLRLDIAGWSSPKAMPEITSLLQRAGVSDAVRFLGVLDNAEVIRRLPGYAAFVLPSSNETFGMTYVEALMAGVPILYSKETGIDGYLDGLDVGIGVPVGDIAALADAIETLVMQAALFRNRIRKNYLLLKRRFGPDAYLAHFRDLVARVNRKARPIAATATASADGNPAGFATVMHGAERGAS